MKAVVTADLHIHPWRECSNDNGADRLDDGLSVLRQTLAFARERKCAWICLGDLKHSKGMWLLPVLNGVLEVFREYEDVPKILLHGNHDGVSGNRSGLDAFRSLPTVWVFDQPDPVSEDLPLWKVALWPHQPTLDALPKFLADARQAKVRVLLAHVFLRGVALGPDDVRLDQGIPLEVLGLAGKNKVFRMAFLGDVHKSQSLGKKNEAAILYVGSPLALNWGEREEGKCAWYVDTEGPDVESLLVRAPGFFVEDWSASEKGARDKLKVTIQTAESGGCWLKGQFIRLILPPGADPKLVERLCEVSGARALQVIVQRAAQAEQRAPKLHAALTAGQMVEEYVRARPPEGLDVKMVATAGKRLWREQ